MSSLIPRNVHVNGRRTSVRLEREMWDALGEICAREGSSVNQVCAQVADTNAEGGFTSGLRVFIVKYFRDGERHANRRPGAEEFMRLAP